MRVTISEAGLRSLLGAEQESVGLPRPDVEVEFVGESADTSVDAAVDECFGPRPWDTPESAPPLLVNVAEARLELSIAATFDGPVPPMRIMLPAARFAAMERALQGGSDGVPVQESAVTLATAGVSLPEGFSESQRREVSDLVGRYAGLLASRIGVPQEDAARSAGRLVEGIVEATAARATRTGPSGQASRVVEYMRDRCAEMAQERPLVGETGRPSRPGRRERVPVRESGSGGSGRESNVVALRRALS